MSLINFRVKRHIIYACMCPSMASLALLSGLALCAESSPDAQQLPKVEVIGTTPLPGTGLIREQIPAPVQTATDADIQRSNAIDLSDFLNRNIGGIHINEMQNNPFQPDVNYRGYTASPLLGTPQGLSIYLDGVRLNQPFGDVVSWDLVPKSAISSITLVPGSNPLFGLNTLGGALSIQTKDGRSHPGVAAQAIIGMHARRATEFEYGGNNQTLDWFVAGNVFRENGWRDDSPSRLGQLFGKLGWRNTSTDLKLTLAHADNKLNGNGLQDHRLLASDYASVYTKPDITENKSSFLNLAANHNISDNLLFSGNAYYRKIRTRTLNGDINEESLDQAVYLPGENASNTPFPSQRCIANVLLLDEAAEKCNGLINRSSTRQDNYGVSGQLTLLESFGAHRNQFTGGAAYDASRARFSQSTELGYLNPDHSVTGLNAFGDGVTGGIDDNGDPFDTRVDLSGRIHTWSLYATDTLSINNLWHLTVSGRYNRTSIRNRDFITPGGGAGSLDGDHKFSRFNPAAGLSFTPNKVIQAYVGYGEGSRAPTAIELGCADPANPCRLPNSMAGDPPLKQVVTKTWELGLHGLANGWRWNAGVFRAENQDDILFVAAPNNTQFGYFKNFGKTRRDGLEAGLSGTAGRLSIGANYTYLDATYQSSETVNGTGNSSNDTAAAGGPGLDGNIQIHPGNRIPLIPRHLLKLHADYAINGALLLGMNFVAVGSAYARGNENNSHTPDGIIYLGPGKSGGYGVLNLNAQYRADTQLKFFAQINNLLNRKYYTGAQLGPTGFTANGNFIARPFPAVGGEFPVQQGTFLAPGAPRMIWLGVRYHFAAPAK